MRSSIESLGSRLEYFWCAENFLCQYTAAVRERPAIVRYAHSLGELGMIFCNESIFEVCSGFLFNLVFFILF